MLKTPFENLIILLFNLIETLRNIKINLKIKNEDSFYLWVVRFYYSGHLKIDFLS